MKLRMVACLAAFAALPLAAACGGNARPAADERAELPPVRVGCLMAVDDLPVDVRDAIVFDLIDRCDERVLRTREHPIDGQRCQEDEICAAAKLRDEGVWP